MNQRLSHPGKENGNYKHGFSGSRLEKVYVHMLSRCYNPKDGMYHRYGGRGITVCDEWRKDNKAFFQWAMSNGYSEELTIDRIDPNGNYCPENCRWATMRVQQNNKTTSLKVEINGETRTVAEWADIYGINRYAVYTRIRKGWDKVEAITTPSMGSGHTRKETIITAKGETHTLSEWARITGINRITIEHRIKYCGWDVDDAVTIPTRATSRYRKEKI